MGCGTSSSEKDDTVETNLDRGVRFLKEGKTLKAKESFQLALGQRPKHSLRVGQDPAAGGGGAGSMQVNPLGQPIGMMPPATGSPRALDRASESNGLNTSNSLGLSGSAVFDKISTSKLHDALATLKLRNRIAGLYSEFGQLVLAEGEYMIAQAGAVSCRHSSVNPEQKVLSNQVWVEATLGVANVVLVEARESEFHSASHHDRLCGFVLAQCSALKQIVNQEEGPQSEDMARVLHLEAQAHAERKNFRQALFSAQKAAGISTKFGVHSEEREKALLFVQTLKEKLQRGNSSHGSNHSEESLEEVAS